MGITTFLALFLVAYPLVSRKKSKAIYHFCAACGSAATWCLGYMLGIASTDELAKRFFTVIEYLGISTLPPLFLLFVLVFTDHGELASAPVTALLLFPPSIFLSFLITNDGHLLFYRSVALDYGPPFVSLDLIYGPVFYIHVIYSYLLMTTGILLLVHTYATSPDINYLYRKQLLLMITATVIPLAGNIIRIFKLVPAISFLDLTPMSFVISFVVYAYSLFETGFLEIIPVARSRVFEEVMDGLIVINSNWRLVDLNTAARAILFPGVPWSSLHGKDVFKLLKNDSSLGVSHDKIDNFRGDLEKISTRPSDSIKTAIEIFHPRDGQQRHYDILVTSLLSQSGKYHLGFVGIIRDVTDGRKAEMALQEKNRMQQLILQLLSHDLRNHLTVIHSHAQLASRGTSGEMVTKSLNIIDTKCKATCQLIEEVSNYLRTVNLLKPGQLQECDLVDCVKSAVQQLQPEITAKDIVVTVETPATPCCILANLTLSSVIANLLVNAIKFSPAGKEVQITVEEKNDYWQVCIADQGPGIPDHLKEEIFEPFISFGKNKGTGLGLTIAREALQFFSGRIWVEDARPRGSVFIFEIPINKIQAGDRNS